MFCMAASNVIAKNGMPLHISAIQVDQNAMLGLAVHAIFFRITPVVFKNAFRKPADSL